MVTCVEEEEEDISHRMRRKRVQDVRILKRFSLPLINGNVFVKRLPQRNSQPSRAESRCHPMRGEALDADISMQRAPFLSPPEAAT
jgi:hypothetical protein